MKEGRRERKKYRKVVEGRERERKKGGGSGKRKKAVRKGREGRGKVIRQSWPYREVRS